jgi:hypothetical protein
MTNAPGYRVGNDTIQHDGDLVRAVSTARQNTDGQHDALTEVECQRICTDTASGRLAALLDYAHTGDVVVITKLDRSAGRSHTGRNARRASATRADYSPGDRIWLAELYGTAIDGELPVRAGPTASHWATGSAASRLLRRVEHDVDGGTRWCRGGRVGNPLSFDGDPSGSEMGIEVLAGDTGVENGQARQRVALGVSFIISGIGYVVQCHPGHRQQWLVGRGPSG